MSERYKLTKASGNRKTGPIAVSTTDRSTCPDACPLKGDGGCFAEQWPLKLHWDKVAESGLGLREFTRALLKLPLGKLWRHNQAGDLPGEGDTLDGAKLAQICNAADKRQLRGFTYTHKPVLPEDVRSVGPDPMLTGALARGNAEVLHAVAVDCDTLTINLSANNPAHYDSMMRMYPALDYAVLIPDDAGKVTVTDDGNRIVWCPAQWDEELTCESCGNGRPLCQRKGRNYAIGFKAHGNRARRAKEVICGNR